MAQVVCTTRSTVFKMVTVVGRVCAVATVAASAGTKRAEKRICGDVLEESLGGVVPSCWDATCEMTLGWNVGGLMSTIDDQQICRRG